MTSHAILQGTPLPLLYKLLTSEDIEACIAAVNMLHALVCFEAGEALSRQQQAMALYGNGAILLQLATRVQPMCVPQTDSTTDTQQLSPMLSLLTSIAEGRATAAAP